MVISERMPGKLVLWDRPVLFLALILMMAGSCLYGAVVGPDDMGMLMRVFLAVLGLGIAAIAHVKTPVQRFVFDRDAGLVHRTQWRLFQRRDDQMDMSRITGIHQRADRFGDGGPTYYIEFEYVSDDGTIEKERFSATSTGKRHDDTIDSLNEWLTRPISPG